MKTLMLLIIVGLLASNPLQAKKIKGEIIFEQDNIAVTFHIPIRLVGNQPDYERLQHRIKYTDGSGKKKVVTPSG